MGTFKKTKVVMLPTKEKSKLVLSFKEKNFNQLVEPKITLIEESNYELSNIQSQHLYFLSDEKIKEGDWILNNLLEDKRPIQVTKELLEDGLLKDDKKIIATTDKSLFTETKSIGYTEDRARVFYGKEYLPQPSQSFIEKFVDEYNEGNVITEVLVEYENSYKKNIDGEDIGFKVHEPSILKVNPKDNTIAIRKVKDSWNREEVVELLSKHFVDAGSKIGLGQDVTKFTKKWIEENL